MFSNPEKEKDVPENKPNTNAVIITTNVLATAKRTATAIFTFKNSNRLHPSIIF